MAMNKNDLQTATHCQTKKTLNQILLLPTLKRYNFNSNSVQKKNNFAIFYYGNNRKDIKRKKKKLFQSPFKLPSSDKEI